ncbi:SDR family oxidoreductase [Rhodococcus sp. Z13]|uniref:SDR family oxidoreductase n=1 Tax=Rhodococcus sacchari TaxID=2962047 RepID=A0ACD4DLD3_9NOCA|nr:SDR family oxidoreductase [Rhodococcus sp. Z13]UYP20849.1 SDR family oxidoreductase [Rhodococcus sp. Z13]
MTHETGPEHLRDAGAVVTGAGHGIGRALAHRLARAGARVVVNDLDAEACTRVAEEIGGIAAPGDAAGEDGVADLVARAQAALGAVDIWFANAGVETGAAETEAAWQLSWDVNVMGHVRAARLLLPEWLERGRGRFVATASAAGLLTMLGSPAYSVTKHAAVAHAEWLAATYGDKGVIVQCLCPQGVATDLLPTDAAGRVIFESGVITPEQVADEVLRALADDRFLILPHPEVADYYAGRAADTERWLRGMRRIQRRIEEARQLDTVS